jgi:hypothetical protein
MKDLYLLILLSLILIVNSACNKTDRGTNETLNDAGKNNLTEESVERSINSDNETVINTFLDKINSENEAVIGAEKVSYSFMFANDYGEKSIKYVSWENVVKFIDYETIAWSTYDRMTGDGDYYIGTYALNVQDNLTFLDVHFDNGNDERWLILANGALCDIYRPGGGYIRGVTGGVNSAEEFGGDTSARSSSYLIENDISYPPGNLGISSKTDKPWVEGVEGHGINEKIFFEDDYFPKGTIHISIGYVSYDRPYLYSQNSRPKTIKLSVEGKFSIIVELRDTPHYQEIRLPSDIYRQDMLILEILDVYPGTKYEDTCINTIVWELYSGSEHFGTNNYWEDQPDR